MKKISFPDPKALQPFPAPQTVHANVSGNVNSTVDTTGGNYVFPGAISSTASPSVSDVSPHSGGGISGTTLAVLVLAAFFLVIFILVRKIWSGTNSQK